MSVAGISEDEGTHLVAAGAWSEIFIGQVKLFNT